MLQGKNIEEGWIMQGKKHLNEKRIHPTQKPVALYAWILKNYAQPGWKLLDTHTGNASMAKKSKGIVSVSSDAGIIRSISLF